MNVTTSKTLSNPAVHNEAPVDLAQLLRTYMPREKLRAFVHERVKQALVRHARNASGSAAMDSADLSADSLALLGSAAAIALPAELCTLMARVGFDKSLFTYGHADGHPAGFAEGIWLLQFVGLADAASPLHGAHVSPRREGRLACRTG